MATFSSVCQKTMQTPLFLLDVLIPMYGCTMVQPIVDCTSVVVALWLYRKIMRESKITLQ